jgi:class 3 adenylate cyclase
MMNDGKQEISFHVASASVMFINIIKFSQYSRNISAQQSMGILADLFGSFDKRLESLTKIKIYGDTYMCASGLFNHPERQAVEEIIIFAQNCLASLENINMKSLANLEVRIGINTGPVIAGVLGSDKLAFDIIGDTINVAARLQSTAEANTIQVSGQTFRLAVHMGLHFQTRRNITLKGSEAR